MSITYSLFNVLTIYHSLFLLKDKDWKIYRWVSEALVLGNVPHKKIFPLHMVVIGYAKMLWVMEMYGREKAKKAKVEGGFSGQINKARSKKFRP